MRFRDRLPAIPDEVLAGTLEAIQKGLGERGYVLLVITPSPAGADLQRVSNLPPEQVLRVIQQIARSAPAVGEPS